jgi:hypothetical protein
MGHFGSKPFSSSLANENPPATAIDAAANAITTNLNFIFSSN